jgi:monoamine oxidase
MVLPFYPGFGTQNALQGLRGIPRRLRTYEGADQSLAEFLDRANPRRGARLVVELLHAHTYAADPDEIGVLGPNEEDRLASKAFGFRNFQIREGYAELVRRKAAHLNGQVQLASRVKSIRWAEPDVRVQIETGNPLRMREVRARKVVITVSLGVLKQQPELFDPPLPPRKRDAIKAIAFGDAYAIHFRFREAPWPQALGDFSMVWGGGASSFHRPHVGEPLGAEYLDAFTVGRQARRRLALSEPEIVQATLDEFRAALARPVRDVPVVGSAMQRWSQMPAFRGAYSYLPVGTGVSARRTLAEPIGGRLFFAGEATHTGGEAATVHGAIETGYRAAEELLQALRTEA